MFACHADDNRVKCILSTYDDYDCQANEKIAVYCITLLSR